MITPFATVFLAFTGALVGYNLGVLLGVMPLPPSLPERWASFGTGPLGAVPGADLVGRWWRR